MNARVMRIGPLLCFVLALAAGNAQAKNSMRDVLGIYPGMPEEEAHERLERFGSVANGAEGETGEYEGREIWSLKHPRFTYVVLSVDREKRVEYVQGFLHKDHKPLRYGDIGDMKKATQKGNYIYVWELPARGKRPAMQLQARGSDPQYAGSYFLLARSDREKGERRGDREAASERRAGP